ncbi:ribonuclease HI [Sphaerotilus hippei]|uniref:Ribonuclease HI n=1 Tax=Sphaerotilus hippei TaxID=744406 RepID=A0A318H1H2_9BURK|nr:ribonuclease HI [Sphaerotilus hippei]
MQRASARFEAGLQLQAVRDGVWQATFDGTAAGGHGRLAGGGLVFAPDGTVHELGVPLPGTGCSNEAEYRALIGVLEWLQAQGARRVIVWGDSELVVRQALGEQSGKAARLAAWRLRLQALVAGFECLDARWIPRHRNAGADRLATAALAGAAPER